jgi:hypothetical protein
LPLLERFNQVYRIENRLCSYDFFYDPKTNVLHVIDLHDKHSISVYDVVLVNAIGFIYHVHKQFRSAFNFKIPPNFRLFIYSQDKILYEWKHDTMHQIPYFDFEKIHLPYLRKKRERKVAYLE